MNPPLKQHPLERYRNEPFPSQERFVEIRNVAVHVLREKERDAWWKRDDVRDAVARGWNNEPAAR